MGETGSHARASLDRLLSRQHNNNLTRAWRRAFCSGPRKDHFIEKLSSRQFAAACRKAGFRGNLRALWGHICESDGFLERSYVNLRIFYPRGFEEVQGFRRICETQFACASEVTSIYWSVLRGAQ